MLPQSSDHNPDSIIGNMPTPVPQASESERGGCKARGIVSFHPTGKIHFPARVVVSRSFRLETPMFDCPTRSPSGPLPCAPASRGRMRAATAETSVTERWLHLFEHETWVG